MIVPSAESGSGRMVFRKLLVPLSGLAIRLKPAPSLRLTNPMALEVTVWAWPATKWARLNATLSQNDFFIIRLDLLHCAAAACGQRVGASERSGVIPSRGRGAMEKSATAIDPNPVRASSISASTALWKPIVLLLSSGYASVALAVDFIHGTGRRGLNN